MDTADLDAARAALVTARRTARAIAPWPSSWQPADLAAACRLQAAVAADLGGVGGWKIAAVTDVQRRTLGVERPIGAPVLATHRLDDEQGTPVLRVADFIVPKLECEFAFELGRDLPPRPGTPYARQEVEDAVVAMRLAIEVVDSRLPPGSGTLAEVADAFNNGALVCGRAVPGWQRLDFGATRIVLRAFDDGDGDGDAATSAGRELALGSGAAILDGDPLATVVMLANAQPEGGGGLRAGHVVTTGSCTGAPPLPGPGLYRAEFDGLGSVELRFVA